MNDIENHTQTGDEITSAPIVHEEISSMPQIESAPVEPLLPDPLSTPQLPAPSNRVLIIRDIVLYIILFIAGMGGGMLLHEVVDSMGAKSIVQDKQMVITPTQTPSPTPREAYVGWQEHVILQGKSKIPLAGVSFRLPGDLLPPICSGSDCASQSTYLPGGSRFVVAVRGKGQILPDIIGKAFTDSVGQPYQIRPTLVGGRPATAYTASFSGTLVSAYAFSHAEGVVVPLTDTVSIDISHHIPKGIILDGQTDAAMFDAILKSITIVNVISPTRTLPSITPTSESLR